MKSTARAGVRMHLMLHDDWEIHGDGTGDPRALMFEPARRLLAICDRFGARYTFFAEVMQQFAMLESGESLHRAWAAEWEDVLRDAVRRGHDVQLHLHPQWQGAEFRDGRWQLDPSRWSIARCPEAEILALLTRGKAYLEDLLRPVRPEYRVVAFRAGGWMAQPSAALVRALRKAGIRADCSVVPGKRARYGEGWETDYSDVPSRLLPWWVGEHDVATCGTAESGVIELPTYAEEFLLPLPLHLLRRDLRGAFHYWSMFRRKVEKEQTREFASSSLGSNGSRRRRLARILAPRSTYCSFGYMHHRALERMARTAMAYASESGVPEAPLVMLTHSKSFFDFSNFDTLLQRLSNEPRIIFTRTRDYVVQVCEGRISGLPLRNERLSA